MTAMTQEQTQNSTGTISVTWDDLQSRKVEQRLKEQDALARNRSYAAMDESMVEPVNTTADSVGGFTALWRNSIFSLALFGLIGGLMAWGCGALLEFKASLEADAHARMADINKLDQRAKEGRLDPKVAALARREAQANGEAENPIFAEMINPNTSDTEKESRIRALADQDRMRELIYNILAFGVRGVIIAVLLAIAIPLTENNMQAVIINGSVGAALGLLGGVAAAFVTSGIQQAAAGAAADSAQQFLATVAIWGAMGLFLTLAPGVVMRNAKKLVIGLTGGLIGGLVGGVLFEPIRGIELFGNSSRFPELVAMIAIGVLAGLSTGLIEDAAKTGWVKVVQGLIAGKQFILYRNPTFIGAGPDCQIYLFKDPKVGKRHAAIHIVPGGYELEDLPLGVPTLINGKAAKRTRLKNGDRVQIGATQLVFMEKRQAP
jgi:hypothetical protein